MSIALFNAVPTGAIEHIFDYNNQPWFKQVGVGDFVGNVNMHDDLFLILSDWRMIDETFLKVFLILKCRHK